MENVINQIPGWVYLIIAVAAIFIRETFSFILRWTGKERRKDNGGDLGEIVIRQQAIQERHTDLIAYIEENGSVSFQKYKSENEEWKRGKGRILDQHSDRLDDAHKRIDTQKEKLDGLLTEHKLLHKGEVPGGS